MRSLLFVLLSFFIVIPVQPARADDARPGYSLTEIVDRALERSLLVRESEKLSESAIHARRQARRGRILPFRFQAEEKPPKEKAARRMKRKYHSRFTLPGREGSPGRSPA
jgi:hypothetical protein